MVLAMALCPSVCPSQIGVLLKRLNLGWHKQHHTIAQGLYRVSQKSELLNILQQQPQICSDLNKILHTKDDIYYKHYYIVSYKSALTLLKYEF